MIEDYKNVRLLDGEHPDYYCGFDPTEPFFVRKRYGSFNVLCKVSSTGKRSYYCPSLNTHIKKLLFHAGIENPSVESGRRTLALRLKGKVDLPTLHKVLGNKDVNTTKKLWETDPVSMSEIANLAF